MKANLWNIFYAKNWSNLLSHCIIQNVLSKTDNKWLQNSESSQWTKNILCSLSLCVFLSLAKKRFFFLSLALYNYFCFDIVHATCGLRFGSVEPVAAQKVAIRNEFIIVPTIVGGHEHKQPKTNFPMEMQTNSQGGWVDFWWKIFALSFMFVFNSDHSKEHFGYLCDYREGNEGLHQPKFVSCCVYEIAKSNLDSWRGQQKFNGPIQPFVLYFRLFNTVNIRVI